MLELDEQSLTTVCKWWQNKKKAWVKKEELTRVSQIPFNDIRIRAVLSFLTFLTSAHEDRKWSDKIVIATLNDSPHSYFILFDLKCHFKTRKQPCQRYLLSTNNWLFLYINRKLLIGNTSFLQFNVSMERHKL